MPESYRLYLDQMIGLEIARALRDQGHDVLRASETGQARADDLFWPLTTRGDLKTSLLSFRKVVQSGFKPLSPEILLWG